MNLHTVQFNEHFQKWIVVLGCVWHVQFCQCTADSHDHFAQ
jgi:hypothetical protein